MSKARNPNKSNAERIDCATCRAQIPDYVRSELGGEEAPERWPSVSQHLSTCPTCELKYFDEFRAQGLQRPLADLQRIGARGPQVTAGLQYILSPPPVSNQSWRQSATEHGSAWFDAVTGSLRQAQVWLGSLLQPDPWNPVLGGLLGAGDEEQQPLSIQVASATGGVDLALRIAPRLQTNEAGDELADLEVRVTLHEHFGDYSGIGIDLLGPATTLSKTTDALGVVVFAGLRRRDLDAMQLLLHLRG